MVRPSWNWRSRGAVKKITFAGVGSTCGIETDRSSFDKLRTNGLLDSQDKTVAGTYHRYGIATNRLAAGGRGIRKRKPARGLLHEDFEIYIFIAAE